MNNKTRHMVLILAKILLKHEADLNLETAEVADVMEIVHQIYLDEDKDKQYQKKDLENPDRS